MGCLGNAITILWLLCTQAAVLVLQVTVHSVPEPSLAAWKGGSVLAASPQLRHRLLTREAWKRTRRAPETVEKEEQVDLSD